MEKFESMSHVRWVCKYHIVFIPRCRRKVISGKLRSGVGKIHRYLCKQKKVEVLEDHAMPDHIHLCVRFFWEQLRTTLHFQQTRHTEQLEELPAILGMRQTTINITTTEDRSIEVDMKMRSKARSVGVPINLMTPADYGFPSTINGLPQVE